MSADQGEEKPPWTAASASAAGLEGANTTFATGSRVLPQLEEKAPVIMQEFFVFKRIWVGLVLPAKLQGSVVSAPTGEKATGSRRQRTEPGWKEQTRRLRPEAESYFPCAIPLKSSSVL